MIENDSQNKNENETQNMNENKTQNKNENETQNMTENGISNTIPQASGAEIPNAVTADDTSEHGKIRSIIPDKFKIITSAHLKWIAIITMFIDHLTATMLEQAPWADFSGNSLRSVMIIVADLILRGIGRIAFPIFIFMMVEGLFYTRSKWKYLSRMAIFALIDFNAFFRMFHQLFFSQGNWELPYDSLLICVLPEAFWASMGVVWFVVALVLSVVSALVGRKLALRR